MFTAFYCASLEHFGSDPVRLRPLVTRHTEEDVGSKTVCRVCFSRVRSHPVYRNDASAQYNIIGEVCISSKNSGCKPAYTFHRETLGKPSSARDTFYDTAACPVANGLLLCIILAPDSGMMSRAIKSEDPLDLDAGRGFCSETCTFQGPRPQPAHSQQNSHLLD